MALNGACFPQSKGTLFAGIVGCYLGALPSRPIPDPPEDFTRVLMRVKFKTVIRSRCDYCGIVIMGTTTDSVWATEMEHRDGCCAPKKPPASASGE